MLPAARWTRSVASTGPASPMVVLKFGESYQLPGVALHDPAAVLYADDGAMFEARPAWVRVETKGSCTYGKTVTDLYSDKKYDMREHLAVINVDRDAFKDRLFELFARFG